MNDNHATRHDLPREEAPTQARIGRALFLVCGGLLLSILVSCACGPVR
jgi:hypothetical protein